MLTTRTPLPVRIPPFKSRRYRSSSPHRPKPSRPRPPTTRTSDPAEASSVMLSLPGPRSTRSWFGSPPRPLPTLSSPPPVVITSAPGLFPRYEPQSTYSEPEPPMNRSSPGPQVDERAVAARVEHRVVTRPHLADPARHADRVVTAECLDVRWCETVTMTSEPSVPTTLSCPSPATIVASLPWHSGGAATAAVGATRRPVKVAAATKATRVDATAPLPEPACLADPRPTGRSHGEPDVSLTAHLHVQRSWPWARATRHTDAALCTLWPSTGALGPALRKTHPHQHRHGPALVVTMLCQFGLALAIPFLMSGNVSPLALSLRRALARGHRLGGRGG